MANFDTIKTAIDANIKTNGTQDITGGKMNSILKQIVDATDEQLTELESEVDGILCEMTSKEVSSVAGANALLFDFAKGKKYKIRVRLSAKVGDFGLYINDAKGSTIHNFGVKHNTDEWIEDDFIPSANADKLMVFVSSANVQINALVFLYKEIIYSEDIADITAEVSTLKSSTNQNTQEIKSLKYDAVTELITKNSVAGANVLLYDFVKGKKYEIKVRLSSNVDTFGLYINDANGATTTDFGIRYNINEWIVEDYIPTSDSDKLMVYISSANVQIEAELTQLKEKDFAALSNIPTIFEFEKRIERELVVGANWNSARFEKGKTYSILVDTTKSLDALGLYTINNSNEVLDNLGVFSGSHVETEFTATEAAPYLVIYASASVSCSCTISEVSKKANDELNHDIALATAFDKSKLSRKCGIVAFIFDDSLPYNDVALGNSCKWIYDEFTKRGLKFTIALSTIAEPIELSKYRRYVDEGHGILSHSIDHLDYVANSIEQVKADCVKTLDWLNNGGLPCRGFVYPNSSRNEEIQQLMRQYYGYAFGMQIKDTHITPNDDLYSLSRFGDVALKTFEQVKAAIDECIESKGLLVLWAHGYWIGTAGHTLQDEVIRMLDYLAEKKYSYEIEQTTVDKAMDMYF